MTTVNQGSFVVPSEVDFRALLGSIRTDEAEGAHGEVCLVCDPACNVNKVAEGTNTFGTSVRPC